MAYFLLKSVQYFSIFQFQQNGVLQRKLMTGGFTVGITCDQAAHKSHQEVMTGSDKSNEQYSKLWARVIPIDDLVSENTFFRILTLQNLKSCQNLFQFANCKLNLMTFGPFKNPVRSLRFHWKCKMYTRKARANAIGHFTFHMKKYCKCSTPSKTFHKY